MLLYIKILTVFGLLLSLVCLCLALECFKLNLRMERLERTAKQSWTKKR